MKPCWCKIILGALVIVFAWWTVSWANIVLTIVGAIIILTSLWNVCCCKGKTCENK